MERGRRGAERGCKRTILYIGTEPYENATVPNIMLRV